MPYAGIHKNQITFQPKNDAKGSYVEKGALHFISKMNNANLLLLAERTFMVKEKAKDRGPKLKRANHLHI